jgi:hypothetical protein
MIFAVSFEIIIQRAVDNEPCYLSNYYLIKFTLDHFHFHSPKKEINVHCICNF